MKISILLPFKENFSPSYAGAVSLFVNDTLKKRAINNIELVGQRISFSYSNHLFSGVFDLDVFGEMKDSLGNWKNCD